MGHPGHLLYLNAPVAQESQLAPLGHALNLVTCATTICRVLLHYCLLLYRLHFSSMVYFVFPAANSEILIFRGRDLKCVNDFNFKRCDLKN